MSYSFTIKGATKEDARHAADAAVDQFVKPQASHKCDIDAIRAALHGFIEAVSEPVHTPVADGAAAVDEEIQVSCHGHCGGHWDHSGLARVTHSEMTVRASVVVIPNTPSESVA